MEHLFSVTVAKEHGVSCAIIVRHIQFWLLKNRANNTNFIDKRTWTYWTIKGLTMVFPYWTEPQIKRTIQTLLFKKVLIRDNFNENKWDKTSWYAFTNEEKWLGESSLSELSIQTPRTDRMVSPRAHALKQDINTTILPEDNKTDKEGFQLPEWISVESWNGFVDMRNETKKPMSPRAKKTLINKLDKYKSSGINPNELLDEAEFRRWQSVYPEKKSTQKQDNHDHNTEYFKNRGLEV